MNNSKKTRKALLSSIVALMLCFSMFVGTTMAWFTDTATTGVNTIQAGELKVDIVDATNTDTSLEGTTLKFADKNGKTEGLLWEPGVTFVTPEFKIKNDGNLALMYKVLINGLEGDSELLDVITFTFENNSGTAIDLASTEKELAAGAVTTES